MLKWKKNHKMKMEMIPKPNPILVKQKIIILQLVEMWVVKIQSKKSENVINLYVTTSDPNPETKNSNDVPNIYVNSSDPNQEIKESNEVPNLYVNSSDPNQEIKKSNDVPNLYVNSSDPNQEIKKEDAIEYANVLSISNS